MTHLLRRLFCWATATVILCAVCACGDDTVSTNNTTGTTNTPTAPSVEGKIPCDENLAPLFTDTFKSISWFAATGDNTLTIRPTNEQDTEELTYFRYAIISPYTSPIDDSLTSKLGSLYTLYADAVIPHPTEEQIAQAGLDHPSTQLEVCFTDNTAHRIAVGDTDPDGTIAVRVNNAEPLYFVSEENYGFLFNLTYEQAMNPYLFFLNIKNIQTMSVRTADLSCDFHLQHDPENPDPHTNMTVTVDDEVYSTDNFRLLYTNLMSITRTGFGGIIPDTEPMLELSLCSNDGNLLKQVSVYASTAEAAIAVFDEGETITIRMNEVTHLLTQIENYLNGKAVTTL